MTGEVAFDIRLESWLNARIAALQSEHPGEKFASLMTLSDLYRFLWRIGFDLELPPSIRHYAASLAFYVMSRVDYIAEESGAASGYIDDLAVSVGGTRVILDEVGFDAISRHWRSDESLQDVLARADALVGRWLPTRVEERVAAYLLR
ncbi:MAG: hypothetical protein HYX75_14770 [Acidobacteria bacterium]|nr:hypothetical protein [Acidobacteriota bacterium]